MAVWVASGLLAIAGPAIGQQGRAAAAAGQVVAGGGGIHCHKRDVLFGNPRTTTCPGVVDMGRALAATPEGRKIAEEGIPPGSARYSILMSKAYARVRRAVKQVAVTSRCDCVVKKGAIRKNPGKIHVMDLTDRVIASLDAAV